MRFVRAAARLDDVRLLGVVQRARRAATTRALYHRRRPRRRRPRRRHADRRRSSVLAPTPRPPRPDRRHPRAAPGPARPGARALRRPGHAAVEIAELFRDKARMKDALRAAGLPCAAHSSSAPSPTPRPSSAEVGLPDGPEAAGRDGRARRPGASARSTSSRRRWRRCASRPSNPIARRGVASSGASSASRPSPSAARSAVHSISHYFPTLLEVIENALDPVVLPPAARDLGAEFDDARARSGSRAIEALGLETGFTHMEWFRREGRIARDRRDRARPPGREHRRA